MMSIKDIDLFDLKAIKVKRFRVIDELRKKFPDGVWYYDYATRRWIDLSGRDGRAFVIKSEFKYYDPLDESEWEPVRYYLFYATKAHEPRRIYFS